jgi:hypothetical protein
MSSDESKNAQVYELDGDFDVIGTPESLWIEALKENRETPNTDGWVLEKIYNNYLRTYTHPSLSVPVIISDSEEGAEASDEFYVVLGGELIYFIGEQDGEVYLMFTTRGFWEINHCFPDQHWGHIIREIYNIPNSVIWDEACENSFAPENTPTEIAAIMSSIGVVQDDEVTAFADQEG